MRFNKTLICYGYKSAGSGTVSFPISFKTSSPRIVLGVLRKSTYNTYYVPTTDTYSASQFSYTSQYNTSTITGVYWVAIGTK